MRILSWNVNGIRAAIRKGFMDWLAKEDPDILCIQETKAQDLELLTPGYRQFWNSAKKKGYSGTLILSKVEPIFVRNDLGIPEHDKEGRVIALEFENYYLVNVYTPNAQRGLARLEYRQEWDRAYLAYLKKLEKDKPVITCGDFNVAHKEIDLARPKENMTTEKKPGNPGFTDQERKGMDNYIDAGFVDTFREFNKEHENYSWWSYMFNARAKNIGWRIDYFLISESLRTRLKDAFILADVMGSDHCPVGIEIESSAN